jgi:predicted AAA+ superfamily ATPase
MNRNIYNYLNLWKNNENRQTLLLRGARQVGKTHAVRHLAKTFTHYLEVNFEEQPQIKTFFEGSLSPKDINEKLAAYFGISLIPGKSLLFFDEIQSCPNALKALRFYHEKNPDLHVVAAGSLLEFVLSEIPSFGVGRIESLFMYPMTFGEFLEAMGHGALNRMIEDADTNHPIDVTLHKRLFDLLKTYQILGGMPQIVQAYKKGSDLRACGNKLDALLSTLKDDFTKYKKRVSTDKLSETFASASLQAGRKFKYANIDPSHSSTGYKEILELLVSAGLTHKIFHSTSDGIPLGAQIDTKKFKVIPFDMGLHLRSLGLDISELMLLDSVQLVNKGSLAEIFVGLELIAGSNPHLRSQLYYWHRESRASNAEVDYVIQKGEEILPIEVKSGSTGKMQSLHLFLEEKNRPQGVRISHEGFKEYGKIKTMPLYAARWLVQA